MNSLKYIFRPTKPIPKNIALKSDELMSNSQRVSTIYTIIMLPIFVLYKFKISADVGTWSYKTKW